MRCRNTTNILGKKLGMRSQLDVSNRGELGGVKITRVDSISQNTQSRIFALNVRP